MTERFIGGEYEFYKSLERAQKALKERMDSLANFAVTGDIPELTHSPGTTVTRDLSVQGHTRLTDAEAIDLTVENLAAGKFTSPELDAAIGKFNQLVALETFELKPQLITTNPVSVVPVAVLGVTDMLPGLPDIPVSGTLDTTQDITGLGVTIPQGTDVVVEGIVQSNTGGNIPSTELTAFTWVTCPTTGKEWSAKVEWNKQSCTILYEKGAATNLVGFKVYKVTIASVDWWVLCADVSPGTNEELLVQCWNSTPCTRHMFPPFTATGYVYKLDAPNLAGFQYFPAYFTNVTIDNLTVSHIEATTEHVVNLAADNLMIDRTTYTPRRYDYTVPTGGAWYHGIRTNIGGLLTAGNGQLMCYLPSQVEPDPLDPTTNIPKPGEEPVDSLIVQCSRDKVTFLKSGAASAGGIDILSKYGWTNLGADEYLFITQDCHIEIVLIGNIEMYIETTPAPASPTNVVDVSEGGFFTYRVNAQLGQFDKTETPIIENTQTTDAIEMRDNVRIGDTTTTPATPHDLSVLGNLAVTSDAVVGDELIAQGVYAGSKGARSLDIAARNINYASDAANDAIPFNTVPATMALQQAWYKICDTTSYGDIHIGGTHIHITGNVAAIKTDTQFDTWAIYQGVLYLHSASSISSLPVTVQYYNDSATRLYFTLSQTFSWTAQGALLQNGLTHIGNETFSQLSTGNLTLTGLTVNGNGVITGNLDVLGNLNATVSATNVNTLLSTVKIVSNASLTALVDNNSTAIRVYVGQSLDANGDIIPYTYTGSLDMSAGVWKYIEFEQPNTYNISGSFKLPPCAFLGCKVVYNTSTVAPVTLDLTSRDVYTTKQVAIDTGLIDNPNYNVHLEDV